jgi:hypothetical protein
MTLPEESDEPIRAIGALAKARVSKGALLRRSIDTHSKWIGMMERPAAQDGRL